MAKPTSKTTTANYTTDPQPQREHISTDAAVFANFRRWQIQGDPQKAVEIAIGSGLRAEREDMIAMYTRTMATLMSDEERRDFGRKYRAEVDGESRAFARIDWAHSSGYNNGTRAAELAAKRAAAEQAAREQVARIETTTAQILAQQEADRVAAAHAMATAMVRK